MKRLCLSTVLIAIAPVLLFGAGTPKAPYAPYSLLTGDEEVNAPVSHPPYPLLDDMDLVGTTEIIGTTWWDNQHNCTIGRMAELSDDGYLHFVWTNGLDYGATQRHIYYNYIDPSGVQGWPGSGYPVESSNRAGYTTLDVDYDGRAFPAFHWTNEPGAIFWPAVGTDFFPHTGTFIVFETPDYPIPEIDWPRMQFDNNQQMQIVASEYTGTTDQLRQFYIVGIYDPISYTISYSPWELVAWTMTNAIDVACSDVSDRTAYAWTHCRDEGFPAPGGNYTQYNNDIYLVIDDDGVDPDWNNPINLTNFIPPDLSYLPDTLTANMDTLRAYCDLNLFFDQDDYLHVAFTTPSHFAIEGVLYYHASIVWHWSEQYPDDFVMIHNAFDDWWWNYTECGAWNMKAQRPSLGQDPNTGNLYCAYQVFDVDTLTQSAGGWPSGEVYVSVSEDGGMNWAVGTNVTETITPNNAAPGQSLSETYPTMAKVVDGQCHIIYVLDKDAGNVLQTEGTWTLNDVTYHNVLVDLIPTTPLVEQNVPFHVEPPIQPVPDMFVEVNYVSGSPIPTGGGTLYYGIWGENQGAVPLDWDGWVDMIHEGTDTSTVINREMTNYLPGWQINRPDMWYPVPGAWPGGNYELRVYSGYWPEYTVWHTDAFNWSKAGAADSGFDFEANLPTASFPDPFGDIAVTQVDYTIPTKFEVMGAYPNPFNPTTNISFALPQDAKVLLSVYDVNGRLVEKLVNGYRPAGVHDVTFDASTLASGVYLYRLEAGQFSASAKMVLMK